MKTGANKKEARVDKIWIDVNSVTTAWSIRKQKHNGRQENVKSGKRRLYLVSYFRPFILICFHMFFPRKYLLVSKYRSSESHNNNVTSRIVLLRKKYFFFSLLFHPSPSFIEGRKEIERMREICIVPSVEILAFMMIKSLTTNTVMMMDLLTEIRIWRNNRCI